MAKKHGLQIGVESKIKYHSTLEVIGVSYESWRRTALNWLQSGLTEDQVEKRLQFEFDLQWAWADSIATEAKQCFDQLQSAKVNQITQLKGRIKAKIKRAKDILKSLEKRLKKPFKNQSEYDRFNLDRMGLKSKVAKIQSLQKDLERLETSDRLHICFGSAKLFNAQHHLEENNYSDRSEWLEDWHKKRSGRFYCVGKSELGGGTMMKIMPFSDDGLYELQITIPRPLQQQYGRFLKIQFSVSDRDLRQRKSELDYALEMQKPVTIQVFRREHKDNQWYVHLTTYVPEVPTIYSKVNGCLGLDFNKDHISAAFVKPDGNINACIEFAFNWYGLSTGQRQARMRDIVAEIVKIAETYGCAIAIESLDFSKKKAAMSEESKLYNEMLSNLSTALFRTSLESRCKRHGVQLIKVNPAFTSVIGMIKFMAKYGLNSGTSAAMAIARRAMNFSEALPKCLARPEDQAKHCWTGWNRVSRYLKKHCIRRSQLFQWMKALEGLLINDENISPSLSVNIGSESKTQLIHREVGL